MPTDRLPSRRIYPPWTDGLSVKDFGGIVLAATLAASCAHRANHAPNPAAGAPAAGKPGSPPPALVSAPGPVRSSPPAPSPDAAPTPAAPHMPPGYRIGTVRAIGTGSRFVLLETIFPESAPGIVDGQELRCVHPNPADAEGSVAIVKVSHERRPPFIVADVLSGQPQAGDDVYAAKGGPTPPPLIAAPTPR